MAAELQPNRLIQTQLENIIGSGDRASQEINQLVGNIEGINNVTDARRIFNEFRYTSHHGQVMSSFDLFNIGMLVIAATRDKLNIGEQGSLARVIEILDENLDFISTDDDEELGVIGDRNSGANLLLKQNTIPKIDLDEQNREAGINDKMITERMNLLEVLINSNYRQLPDNYTELRRQIKRGKYKGYAGENFVDRQLALTMLAAQYYSPMMEDLERLSREINSGGPEIAQLYLTIKLANQSIVRGYTIMDQEFTRLESGENQFDPDTTYKGTGNEIGLNYCREYNHLLRTRAQNLSAEHMNRLGIVNNGRTVYQLLENLASFRHWKLVQIYGINHSIISGMPGENSKISPILQVLAPLAISLNASLESDIRLPNIQKAIDTYEKIFEFFSSSDSANTTYHKVIPIRLLKFKGNIPNLNGEAEVSQVDIDEQNPRKTLVRQILEGVKLTPIEDQNKNGVNAFEKLSIDSVIEAVKSSRRVKRLLRPVILPFEMPGENIGGVYSLSGTEPNLVADNLQNFIREVEGKIEELKKIAAGRQDRENLHRLAGMMQLRIGGEILSSDDNNYKMAIRNIYQLAMDFNEHLRLIKDLIAGSKEISDLSMVGKNHLVYSPKDQWASLSKTLRIQDIPVLFTLPEQVTGSGVDMKITFGSYITTLPAAVAVEIAIRTGWYGAFYFSSNFRTTDHSRLMHRVHQNNLKQAPRVAILMGDAHRPSSGTFSKTFATSDEALSEIAFMIENGEEMANTLREHWGF